MGYSISLTNIYNEGNKLFLFHRVNKVLKITKEVTFQPYFYQESANGVFRSIDNKRVRKVECKSPYDISKLRDDKSYEADVIYIKRFIIDKVTDITKTELKYFFIDIEVLTKALPDYNNPIQPIICISLYNSYTKSIKTWFINDYDGVAIEEQEDKLLADFCGYIFMEQPDILLGWNFTLFDYPYIFNRMKKELGVNFSDMISPLNKSRYGMEDISYPAGISIIDYLEWFKKIYTRESSYALDSIAQVHLNEAPYKKTNFNQISEEIKEKNINDIKRLIKLEEKFKIIHYYDELRRMGKCLFEDMNWNSKVIDMLLLQEAKQKSIVLPSKLYSDEVIVTEEDGFEGAYRRADLGLFENIYKLDLSSAYPASIANLCLDISNISETEGLPIDITDRKTGEVLYTIKMKQNPDALLPTVAKKLITKKDILKKKLSELSPDSEEYNDLQTKYDCTKALVNSLFGVCGLKVFRLYNKHIASAITSIVRSLLHYVEDKLQAQGMKVIYVDTDSVFTQSKENPQDLLNGLVVQWAKETFNKDKIDIKFDCEGKYISLLIVALCHYVGDLLTPKGKIKREIKGVEIKRKDSSVFMKKFQETLINKVLKKEPQDKIIEFIKSEQERIKTVPLVDIGFPCKVNSTKVYKSVPIFSRALDYTKELVPGFDKPSGDMFYFIYITKFGTAIRKSSRMRKNKETGKKELQKSEKEIDKNVLAFDEYTYSHIQKIDWSAMINKTIVSKAEAIFECMSWDFSEFVPKRIKKENKVKNVKVTQEIPEAEVLPCDFIQCKQNNEGMCKTSNDDNGFLLCPKNNEQSVYENPELLKDNNE